MLRATVPAWCLALALLLASDAALARAPFSSTAKPASFKEIFKVIYDYDVDTGSRPPLNMGPDGRPTAYETIPPYLQYAQCGGSSSSEPVAGKIAQVVGLPGHLSEWDAAIRSGMAVRKVGPLELQFPDSTFGRSTACEPNKGPTVTKNVWRNGGRVDLEFQNPDFKEVADPPCLWRTDPGWSPMAISEGAPVLIGFEIDKPHSPQKCEELKNWTNNYSYRDCKFVGPDGQCCLWADRYTCTDAWKDSSVAASTCPALCVPACGNGICNPTENIANCAADCAPPPAPGDPPLPPPPPPGPQPPNCIMPATTEYPNGVDCNGDECRCKRTDGLMCTKRAPAAMATQLMQEVPNGQNGVPVNGWLTINVITNRGATQGGDVDYMSFYREYQFSYSRAAVPSVPGDTTSNSGKSACYGFYDEFDPIHRQTVRKDRRCTINIDVSYYRDTQMGKGGYGSVLMDANPAQNSQQRKLGAINEQNDLWIERLGLSYALLLPKQFKEKYETNLSRLFLDSSAFDIAWLRAEPQVGYTQSTKLAKSNEVRAFDDTGTGRTATLWIQKQQIEASSLFHPPVVTLILPSALVRNIAQTDPLFATLPAAQRALRDPRSETVELQIFAREDILGDALGYLERALLPLEEETMKVALPLASSAELKARAQALCSWYMEKYNKNECTSAPAEITDSIRWLNDNADKIDQVRYMRGELYRYAGKLLDLQNQLAKPLGQWLTQNKDKYDALVAQQQFIQTNLVPKWQSAQGALQTFSDVTNMPWCMNQRFTDPIYSLLDEWMPSRQEGGSMFEKGLNDYLKLSSIDESLRPKDYVVDLSRIRFMTGSIRVPVIKPVQIRMDLPMVPGLDGKLPEVPPQLPDFAAIANSMIAGLNSLPTVNTGSVVIPPSPLPDPIPQATLDRISASLDGLLSDIGRMDQRYNDFWQSIGPLRPDRAPRPWTSAEREFAQKKQRLECDGWDDAEGHCEHVEMDLKSRVLRVGSRPDVQLREDYSSSGTTRAYPGVCLPHDDSCTVMHPERTGEVVEWNIFMQKDEAPPSMNVIRDQLRDRSMKEPVGTLNSSAAPKYDVRWDEILPGLDNPPPVDLKP